jgi:uncharacterized membrane protein
MQTSTPQSRRLRDYTSIPFEIFIVTFTLLPFFVLAYFYPALPERVPLFLNLSGEVETWVEKSLLSVFRVSLIAVVMQVVCLLMKYGVVQLRLVAPRNIDIGRTKLLEQSLSLNAGLWDWFRWCIAFKMIAESLDTIFLSLERFKFLSRPAFIVSVIATLLGAVGALFYVYRLLAVSREMKRNFVDTKVARPIDAHRVYGGVFYFNRSDSAMFAGRYVLNFGNKWAWVFILCFIAYPLLAFW